MSRQRYVPPTERPLVEFAPDEIMAAMRGDRMDHRAFWLKLGVVMSRYVRSSAFRAKYGKGGWIPRDDHHDLVLATLTKTYERRAVFLENVAAKRPRNLAGFLVAWVHGDVRWTMSKMLSRADKEVLVVTKRVSLEDRKRGVSEFRDYDAFWMLVASGHDPMHQVEVERLLRDTMQKIGLAIWTPLQFDALARLIFAVENADGEQLAALAKRVGTQDQRMADALRAARKKLRTLAGVDDGPILEPRQVLLSDPNSGIKRHGTPGKHAEHTAN